MKRASVDLDKDGNGVGTWRDSANITTLEHREREKVVTLVCSSML